MSDGTGGRFPSDGDEADEELRRVDGPGTSGETAPDLDPETDGIEILDDGADWLATQLAALPPDTSELPIVASSPDGSDAADGSDTAGSDSDGSDTTGSVEGESDAASRRAPDRDVPDAHDSSATPTALLPEGLLGGSDEESADSPSVPPLTRARATGPRRTGWLGRREPVDGAPQGAGVPAPAPPAEEGQASAAPADDGDALSMSGPVAPDRADSGDVPENDPADVPPRSSRSAHPNAIIIPGLPPRSAAPPPAVTPSNDSETTRHADRSLRDDTAVSAPDEPRTDEPRSVEASTSDTDETGEIPFGAFGWSLVANDEPDPMLERERRAAEAEAERRAAEESAAQPTASESTGSRATSAGTDGDDDPTPGGVDAGWLATTPLPGSIPPRPPLPTASPASPTPVDERPTWSRPDLDDRFPATAAMDALPADEDPDDPDDEIEGADRDSLGTTGLPVSAARAAAGSVEHVPVSSAAAGAGGVSVFPAGVVTDTEGDRSRRLVPPSSTPAGAPVERTRLLGLIGAGVVIVLALVALFFLGTRLPLILGGSPQAEEAAAPTPTPTPTPAEEAPATGPLAPGTYAWDELRGGECLEPFESPWAEEFTVVDCAEPHAAQLVFEAPYTDDPAMPFPGEEVIASEIGLLCSAPGVIDFAAAEPFTDLQVQGAYPVSGEQWAAGQRSYFCFASRSSGESLTTSVATIPTP
ncbi:hypothetical protein ELQ92_03570 [Labedella populi]|uniref:Septum formation-related domain-containing protein n=1 Tax=Labedella populi TaxID=2498850 RepID=A0A444QFJ5_9MICO|nr:hypothetical protein [Labedella populi]RWZ68309.1 hypothetical protein ELQ92_03570 [Labedella populi]